MTYVVNLAFLRASNGMFWYAVDKIRSLGSDQASCRVLASPSLAALVRRELPLVSVEEIGRLGSWRRIAQLKRQTRAPLKIVTFTSHPIPFVGGQTIAFYDDYPFQGRGGAVKRALFALAARTSRCRIGIINRSLALPFLHGCGITADRIFFDSAFPAVDLETMPPRLSEPAVPLRIGLVGTDSRKKDYAAIFNAVRAAGASGDVRFLLYGAENDYAAELRRDFPEIDQQIVTSDTVGMPEFFAMIDYIVSASVGEGYGRPMGLAAQLGVPMFLLRSPVFLEFFADHATFFDDVSEMIRRLVAVRPPASRVPSEKRPDVSGRSPYFD